MSDKKVIMGGGDGLVTDCGLRYEVKDDTGNCYTACIAMLTGISFDDLKYDVGAPETWTRDKERERKNTLVELLHKRGWCLLFTGNRIPCGLSIATGDSPRGKWAHCWIARNGERYFDPHPSNEFTPNIFEFEILIPIIGQLPE